MRQDGCEGADDERTLAEWSASPIRAQAWLNDHAREVEGLELDEAVALVESAGLYARVIHYPGGWMTQELRHDRINLWPTQDGSIASIDAG